MTFCYWFDSKLTAKMKLKYSVYFTLLNLLFGLQNIAAQNAEQTTDCFQYYNAGDYNSTVICSENLLKLLKKELGKTEGTYASVLLFTANVYNINLNNFQKAVEKYAEYIDLQEGSGSSENEKYLNASRSLSKLYISNGQFEKAEPLLIKELHIIGRLNGEKSEIYGIYLNNLSVAYKNNGELYKALPLCKQALIIQEELLPKGHINFAYLYSNLGDLYALNHNEAQAELSYNEAIKIFKDQLGDTAFQYLDLKNNLALYYNRQNNYDKAEKLFIEIIETQKKILNGNEPSYAVSLVNLAELYIDIDQFAKADKLLTEAVEIRKNKFGEKDERFADVLGRLASIKCKIGDCAEAIKLNQQKLAIIKLLYGENAEEYAFCLHNLAFTLNETGNKSEAIQYYIMALEIRKKLNGSNNLKYAATLHNLGKCYLDLGDYEVAEKALLKAADIIKAINQNEPTYAITLNDIGNLYCSIGNYNYAESFYLQSLKLRKDIYGDSSLVYAQVLGNLALFYEDLGDYDKALDLNLQTSRIKERVLGTNHLDYATTMNNLGSTYEKLNNYEKALEYYMKALHIKTAIFNENSLEIVECFNNIGVLQMNYGYLSMAEACFNTAVNNFPKGQEKTHPTYINVIANLALLYDKMEKNEKAEKLYLEALFLKRSLYGKTNESIAFTEFNMFYFYLKIKNYEKSLTHYNNARKITIDNLKDNFVFMNEKEKEYFLTTNINEEIFYNFSYFAIRYKGAVPEFTGNVYDNLIFTKGLLLSLSNNLTTTIMNSGNDTLKIQYSEWIRLRKKIAKVSGNEEINKNIADALIIEKKLNRGSEAFLTQNTLFDKSWNVIKRNLNTNEVAIEFTNYNQNDSIIYCALIIKKDSKYPEMIPLFEEKQIIPLLTSIVAERGIELLEVKENVNFGRDLYKLVWKPLEGHLQGIKKIYYSPSGLLNKVSFASLEDTGGTMLIDRFELHQLQSTADIEEIKENKFNLPNSIALFGGANYNLSADSMHVQAIGLSKPADIQLTAKRTLPSSTNTNWTYLPGTLTEVNAIKKTFTNSKLVQTYSSNTATEDQLKALSGFSSPKIIHIATHGYYIPELKRKEKMDFIPIRNESQFTSSINPLLRTGLILAGANNKWVNNIEIDGADDGILTALEISNLNFMNTDLVVLSACETGLGDIKGSEGVYGLQRAFRLAGVKRMIVSLWQVPDNETAEMMEYFYTSLMNEKKGYYAAFRAAQNKMKQKYPFAPIKWAGFVLIGE